MSANASKPLFYKWDKVYTSDRWYPVGSYVEHSHDRMAEFQVVVEPAPDNERLCGEAENKLAERIAVLMNLAAGICTADLGDAVIVLQGDCP